MCDNGLEFSSCDDESSIP